VVCIVAFIVVLVLSAVSAKYRKLLGKAWGCAWRRVTLRPCDTTFRDDVKNSLLAPLAVRAPRLVRPASIAIEVLAWLMVLSLIVSLYLVGRSGLNLLVYGTCDKQNAQACSLAAQACSIDAIQPGFWEAIGEGDVFGAFGREFASVGDTIATVPVDCAPGMPRTSPPPTPPTSAGTPPGVPRRWRCSIPAATTARSCSATCARPASIRRTM
jgi:hypothetical protein